MIRVYKVAKVDPEKIPTTYKVLNHYAQDQQDFRKTTSTNFAYKRIYFTLPCTGITIHLCHLYDIIHKNDIIIHANFIVSFQ